MYPYSYMQKFPAGFQCAPAKCKYQNLLHILRWVAKLTTAATAKQFANKCHSQAPKSRDPNTAV